MKNELTPENAKDCKTVDEVIAFVEPEQIENVKTPAEAKNSKLNDEDLKSVAGGINKTPVIFIDDLNKPTPKKPIKK